MEVFEHGMTPFPEVGSCVEFMSAPLIHREKTIKQIQLEVCRQFNVGFDAMVSSKRTRSIAWPRMWAMARCVKETHHSTTVIGREFNRDHTTVLYAFRVFGMEDDTKSRLHKTTKETMRQFIAKYGKKEPL